VVVDDVARRRLSIVVGVTGGIAAYKAVSVVRELVTAGHDVQVIATENALRFIGRPTFEAISRNPVYSDLYEGVAEVRHVSLGQRADVIIIAPATATTIARLAAGFADDLLTSTVLASSAPVVIAPAMHTEMWSHPATRANVATLRQRGLTIVGPASGRLTGDDSGPGRMSEPAEIVREALAVFAGAADLAGIRVLVTAGGTREPMDPVRFIGNRSSGKQGLAVAVAAAARGASVTVIGAHLEVPHPPSMQVVTVETTAELRATLVSLARDADVIVMAAAVADYRPDSIAPQKIKKSHQADTLTVRLVKNPDLLAELVARRTPDQTIIGFAAETETDRSALLELGRQKVKAKGCDLLVVNTVGTDRGFGTDDNTVIVLDRSGVIVAEASGTKRAIADHLLDLVSISS